jgi:hypothetical protein
MSDLPLLEFDPDEEAVLHPASTQAGVDAPIAAVGCFFPELLDALPDRRELIVLSSLTPPTSYGRWSGKDTFSRSSSLATERPSLLRHLSA